jgi:hypothetical protein
MEDAAPAIGPRPLPEVDTVGSMPEVPGGSEAKKNDSAGQKPSASAERPRKMIQPAVMKAITGATNAVEVQRQNETAISGAGSVTGQRGPFNLARGLNGSLAIIMAREYGCIMNPPQGLGKMGVYRKWAAQLVVGHLDTDGSKVRKGVTWLKKFAPAGPARPGWIRMGPGLPMNFDYPAYMSSWHLRDTWLTTSHDGHRPGWPLSSGSLV